MRQWTGIWIDRRGSVAPTVALSLVGLIAAGGIAFDYARLASMDTELQQAADQAALAAATQLDGATGACGRAAAAAASLLSNEARFANDGLGRAISVGTESTCDATGNVQFYQSYDEVNDTVGSAATSAANAKVVIVTVNARQAKYALTPIVGVFSSGNVTGSAVATLSQSICKVPPMMICAPGTEFPETADIGKGVMLEPGGGGAWTAGNYGYLDFGNGASGVKINLGKNNEVANCTDNDEGIPTEPGNQASVTKFLNTRFDLYAAAVTACNSSNGDFCPSQNTRKDLATTEEVEVNGTATTTPANPGCGAPGAKVLNGDNNVDTGNQTQGSTPAGFPRDIVQRTDSSIKFGDGDWGRDAFLTATHPSDTATSIATAMGTTAAKLKRWDVYQWELQDKANRLKSTSEQSGSATFKENGNSGNGKWTFTNRCSYPQPKTGTGVAAGSAQKDRRLLTVAVVDCSGKSGKFDAKVLRFADMFLVEPSLDRSVPYATGKDQIYAEVVSVAKRANGQSAFQYYLRQRPRLLK